MYINIIYIYIRFIDIEATDSQAKFYLFNPIQH